jgi:hypothetical protein
MIQERLIDEKTLFCCSCVYTTYTTIQCIVLCFAFMVVTVLYILYSRHSFLAFGTRLDKGSHIRINMEYHVMVGVEIDRHVGVSRGNMILKLLGLF